MWRLQKWEHILIIDDFLVNGCALQSLTSIAESAGAIVEAMDAETGTIIFRAE